MIDLGNPKNKALTKCWLDSKAKPGFVSKELERCCENVAGGNYMNEPLCKALPQNNAKLPIDIKSLFYYLKNDNWEGN